MLSGEGAPRPVFNFIQLLNFIPSLFTLLQSQAIQESDDAVFTAAPGMI